MKFCIQENGIEKRYTLIYDSLVFGTNPDYDESFTSILINDIQLEINELGEIMYVWGYCPLVAYEKTEEIPKKYESKRLAAILDETPIPGVSYRINDVKGWPLYINISEGWVCFGDPKLLGDKRVEFFPNAIAILENQEIRTLWLKPEKLPPNLW